MARLATMTVWDVQLGLAIHVKAPNGKYIVIDLGTGTYESGNSTPILKRRFDNIAYMILTHPHLDHISDILNFDINQPKILLRPKSLTNAEVMYGVRIYDRGSYDLTWNEEISARNKIYFRPTDTMGFLATDMRLENIEVYEKESLDILMKRSDFKDAVRYADVLVAPHHGRESAYHSDFVSLVNPRVTIISDTNKSDASASDKYTKMSRGWKVGGIDRKCITTRNDGNITVVFGECDDPAYSGTLRISTSK